MSFEIIVPSNPDPCPIKYGFWERLSSVCLFRAVIACSAWLNLSLAGWLWRCLLMFLILWSLAFLLAGPYPWPRHWALYCLFVGCWYRGISSSLDWPGSSSLLALSVSVLSHTLLALFGPGHLVAHLASVSSLTFSWWIVRQDCSVWS